MRVCVCVCVVLVSCSDLLELLDLCLVKHGKDVGGGSLATLLWVLLPGCSGSTLEGGREGGREEGRGGEDIPHIPKRIHTQGARCVVYQQLIVLLHY